MVLHVAAGGRVVGEGREADVRGVGACRREAGRIARELRVHGYDECCETHDEADDDGAGDPEGKSRGWARRWSSQTRCYHVLSRGIAFRIAAAYVAAGRGAA